MLYIIIIYIYIYVIYILDCPFRSLIARIASAISSLTFSTILISTIISDASIPIIVRLPIVSLLG